MAKTKSRLEELPIDIALQILNYVPPSALWTLRLVCKTFHSLSTPLAFRRVVIHTGIASRGDDGEFLKSSGSAHSVRDPLTFRYSTLPDYQHAPRYYRPSTHRYGSGSTSIIADLTFGALEKVMPGITRLQHLLNTQLCLFGGRFGADFVTSITLTSAAPNPYVTNSSQTKRTRDSVLGEGNGDWGYTTELSRLLCTDLFSPNRMPFLREFYWAKMEFITEELITALATARETHQTFNGLYVDGFMIMAIPRMDCLVGKPYRIPIPPEHLFDPVKDNLRSLTCRVYSIRDSELLQRVLCAAPEQLNLLDVVFARGHDFDTSEMLPLNGSQTYHLPQLTTLILRDVSIKHREFSAFTAATNLTTLILDEFHADDEYVLSEIIGTNFPKLEKIHLLGTQSDFIPNLVHARGSCPGRELSEINLQVSPKVDPNIIVSNRMKLRVLRLIDYPQWGREDLSSIEKTCWTTSELALLAECHLLQEVHIDLERPRGTEWDPALLNAFGQLPPSLKYLSICFHPPPRDSAQARLSQDAEEILIAAELIDIDEVGVTKIALAMKSGRARNIRMILIQKGRRLYSTALAMCQTEDYSGIRKLWRVRTEQSLVTTASVQTVVELIHAETMVLKVTGGHRSTEASTPVYSVKKRRGWHRFEEL
ncbi:hypothetical protein BDZ91DRAFT_747005 [Kalaharituber pfeilii]|nr:hypothetical protein BDZ91DRAFT_747005 [Kalaharituber pfeilii]